MDKNIQFAINKGYPIVKIALTLEDAKALRDVLAEHRDLTNYAAMDGAPLTAYVANLIDNAIIGLEA